MPKIAEPPLHTYGFTRMKTLKLPSCKSLGRRIGFHQDQGTIKINAFSSPRGTPPGYLVSSTIYTITDTTGVRNLVGNTMNSPYIGSFLTLPGRKRGRMNNFDIALMLFRLLNKSKALDSKMVADARHKFNQLVQ